MGASQCGQFLFFKGGGNRIGCAQQCEWCNAEALMRRRKYFVVGLTFISRRSGLQKYKDKHGRRAAERSRGSAPSASGRGATARGVGAGRRHLNVVRLAGKFRPTRDQISDGGQSVQFCLPVCRISLEDFPFRFPTHTR